MFFAYKHVSQRVKDKMKLALISRTLRASMEALVKSDVLKHFDSVHKNMIDHYRRMITYYGQPFLTKTPAGKFAYSFGLRQFANFYQQALPGSLCYIR